MPASAADGIGLDEHLGKAKELLDFVIDRSPQGEIMLNAGAQAVRYHGNWKMLPENSVENYHGPFVHKVAFALSDRRAGRVRASITKRLPDQEDETLYFVGGHMAEYLPRQGSPTAQREPSAARRAYIDSLTKSYGGKRARELVETLPSFLYIFPNLYVLTNAFPALRAGERRRDPRLLSSGAAQRRPGRDQSGDFALSRDLIWSRRLRHAGRHRDFERNQAGLQAQGDEWLYIGRGLHRETKFADGGTSGHFMDEGQIRGMWRHYAWLMSEP